MNSTSPRSLRRPEPQVVDWSKASPFHVPCVRCCVDKSMPTVSHLNRTCFPSRLRGCARLKLRVPTPFDPLSSFTGGGNWTPRVSAHALVKRTTTASKHVPIVIARQGSARYHKDTLVRTPPLFQACCLFNNRHPRLPVLQLRV
jgi:hypothetical protein